MPPPKCQATNVGTTSDRTHPTSLSPVADPDPNADWWTTTDVARYTGVAVHTISTYRARGHMPAADTRVGRTWMWRPQRIIDWHAARRAAGRRPDRYTWTGARETSFTRDHGLDWEDYTLDREFTVEPAGEHVAELLALDVGTPVLVRRFVFRARDVVEQMSTSVLPYSLVEGTPVEDPANEPWPGGTIGQMDSLGITVDRITETPTAGLPTVIEAATLAQPITRPVLRIERVMYAGGRPVEAAVPITLPGLARVTYTVTPTPPPRP